MFVLAFIRLLVLSSAGSSTWFARRPSQAQELVRLHQERIRFPALTFNQPIDHFPNDPRYRPHTDATFKQRYFFDDTYYKPGGPVFLFPYVEGGDIAQGLEANIVKQLMKQFNGLGIVLENRYYGESFPFKDSSTDHLAYLTVEQSIADYAYFARHVSFPGVEGNLNAPKTPWILYGTGLIGARVAFSIKTYGADTLYAGIVSSGDIYTTLAYSEWQNAALKWAPGDCTSRISNIIDNFDALRATKNTAAISHFKSLFGLAVISDDRDFAFMIGTYSLEPWFTAGGTWSEKRWYRRGSEDSDDLDEFWDLCRDVSAVRGLGYKTAWARVDNEMKAATGKDWTGLGGYAASVKRLIPSDCLDSVKLDSLECFRTHNPAYWADTANTEDRSAMYTICVEFGGYRVAQPKGPSLISRALQTDYTQQLCNWSFPSGEYNTIPETPDISRWNKYGALNFSAERLAFIDGDRNGWLDRCYHSNKAPLRHSSDLHRAYLIVGAGPSWDFPSFMNIEMEPRFIREAHKWQIRTVKRWLDAFPSWKPKRRLDAFPTWKPQG